MHLGAGLSVGLSGLAAGFAIGIVGDAGVRGTAQQPRLFVGMILILIFAEVSLQQHPTLHIAYRVGVGESASYILSQYGCLFLVFCISVGISVDLR